ncbi:MAG: transporter [Bacteroidota bacterium]
MKSTHIIYIILLSFFTNTLSAQYNGSRPDGHAPIGVMGDHTHKKGELMFSYRWMYMPMSGNLVGSDAVSNAAVLESYMVVPEQMAMQMHMLGAMYAPTDKITLMLMGNYVTNNMDLLTRMGGQFSTASSGLGDTRLGALIKVAEFGRNRLHFNAFVSLPTGSIENRDDTPAGNIRLPYPMQLGSGTFDLMPGVTYLGQNDLLSWGVQAKGIIRPGTNSADYAFGDQFMATAWGAIVIADWLSASVRLDNRNVSPIRGQDAELNPMMVSTADPVNFGGQRLDGLLGLNFYARSGGLKGLRIAAEFGLPLYQNLNGPQMQVQSVLNLGLQYAL